MSTSPLVTVVIPCFNQAHYLPGALASVHRQTWPRVECIVIDDGSTDDTSRVAESLGATRVKRQENLGLSRARNAGLELARGEFIVFLDADDELLPNAIRDGLDAFERHPEAGCIAGRCALMDTNGRPLPTTHQEVASDDLYAQLLKINFVWTPGAAMFRTRDVREIGGFPARHPAAADYAVILAFARRRQLRLEYRDVVRYRKHQTNMSRDSILMLKATLSVLERERRHLAPQYMPILFEGRRRWRAFYGERLSVDLRREWRGERRLAVLARGALFFCRHCPREAVAHVWRKLLRVVRRLPSADLDPQGHERAQIETPGTRDDERSHVAFRNTL
jgi:glycosyltransferase involved in cell wall biosynthesis